MSEYKRDQLRAAECEGTPLLCTQHRKHRQHSRMALFFCRQSVADRKLLVDVLSICFGIGAWIAINGLFVQLPLLVQTQPEGWNLPSYLSVIVQIANIGPILYAVTSRMCAGKVRDSTIIYGVLVMGTIALLLMAFFYKETTVLFGEERSTALFSLVFFIALVGCTSSVLFMPYMGNFRDIYLISYFVGEGLSGFLPSVVALVQGVGGNPTCINQTEPDGSVNVVAFTPLPNFSTQVYFFFLFGTSAVSTFSFFLLNNLSTSKGEKVKYSKQKPRLEENTQNHEQPVSGLPLPSSDFNLDKEEPAKIHPDLVKNAGDVVCLSNENIVVAASSQITVLVKNETSISSSLSTYLLLLVSWVALLGNGVFPSIQSYSCLPYGNVVYHLSATLGSMANPVACFLAFFLPISSILTISILTLLCTGVSCYILATALTSPSPPLVNTPTGDALIVLCWILDTGLISYVKMSIASIFRREGGRGLFWCGAVQQTGSAIGALITFFLVNYADIFIQYYPCQ